MLTGQTPFVSDEKNETLRMILKEEAIFPDYVAKSARDFISKLIKKYGKERPVMQEVGAHPWIMNNADRTSHFKKYWIDGRSAVVPKPLNWLLVTQIQILVWT